jgi:hypothetical protein
MSRSGDLDMTDGALAGPAHPRQSDRQISQSPILNRRSILRASSTQERGLPCDGKNLTETSATLSTGYKTAANIVPAATLKLRPTLLKFPVE